MKGKEGEEVDPTVNDKLQQLLQRFRKTLC